MGNYTKYRLKLSTLANEQLKRETEERIEQYIADGQRLCLYDGIEAGGSTGEQCKWYNYKNEMVALSRFFPDVLFSLRGDGEESKNIWVHYFFGGKSKLETAIIHFPEFDESKLKD